MSGRTEWWRNKTEFVLKILGVAQFYKTYNSAERGSDTGPGLIPILFLPFLQP